MFEFKYSIALLIVVVFYNAYCKGHVKIIWNAIHAMSHNIIHVSMLFQLNILINSLSLDALHCQTSHTPAAFHLITYILDSL